MDHPVKDIRAVIKTLCQGTPEEQKEAVNRYFLPSASFVHPFCRIPSFDKVRVPILNNELNSRMLILAVYKWYKILSPKIDIEIESTVFDQRAGLLYITIAQTFSIWFFGPLHNAPVRLVTVLRLVPTAAPSSSSSSSSANNNPPRQLQPKQNGTTHEQHDDHEHDEADDGPDPSYAQVASGEAHADGHTPPNPALEAAIEANNHNHHNTFSASSSSSDTTTKRHTTTASTTNESGGAAGGNNNKRQYKIASQEDYYQVNEFLKFLLSSPGAALWKFVQVIVTAWCVVAVAVFEPVMRTFGPKRAGGFGPSGKAIANGNANANGNAMAKGDGNASNGAANGGVKADEKHSDVVANGVDSS